MEPVSWIEHTGRTVPVYHNGYAVLALRLAVEVGVAAIVLVETEERNGKIGQYQMMTTGDRTIGIIEFSGPQAVESIETWISRLELLKKMVVPRD